MNKIKVLLFALFFTPTALFAASDFQTAAQLLAAAKNADIQQVQALVNNGANVNFVDATGLSLVCTALMNNDVRAAQILQMYGADASNCDRQIKKYNQKKPTEDSGGLFGGLSSAQGIALAAAGAAVVVGGVLLLGDVFSPGNSNAGTGGGAMCRPNASCTCQNGASGTCNASGSCSCGTTPPNPATADITLPYGPAMPNATSESQNYTNNLNFYSPSLAGILKDNYNRMTNTYAQNYLLMMHGYSPLARGYLGMRTLRNATTHEPIPFSGSFDTEPIMGDRPANVAIVTANGVNAKMDTSLQDRWLVWTTLNASNIPNAATNNTISSKYYNNVIVPGVNINTLADDKAVEDLVNLDTFDLSKSGTAINNSFATDSDNLLAKVVGGLDSGYTTADFYGFMPNGQMTIFRTGGGMGMKAASGAVSGTFVDNGTAGWNTGDVLNLFTYALTVTLNTNDHGFSATDGVHTYLGYRGADGMLYLDTDADGKADQVYKIETNNDLTFNKQLGVIDYLNYKALMNAGAIYAGGDIAGGRSRVDVIANASVITPMRSVNTKTISDILSAPAANRQSEFIKFVNMYYNFDGRLTGTDLQGTNAASFFGALGSSYSPLVVFSTGSFETDSTYSGQTLEATFENAAPLVFNNLEHLFMSAVAVGLTGTGTNGTSNVSDYASGTVPSNTQIALSQWHDTALNKYYKARTCGIGGSGANGIDPWCFAAAGLTDERAVASLAGAAGAMKSAFPYLDNKKLFALMALTADGPYLASTLNGAAMTQTDLIAQLKSMYLMPAEYQYRWEFGGEDYLKVFKEVFGYGLVNLERATKPTSQVFYFNGTDIVSANGNGFWRRASNRTTFRSSGAIRPRAASISAPFFDILESTDGSLSLPRIWENGFATAPADAHGLYMGDVLGEFNTSNDAAKKIMIGKNASFSMAVSEKSYSDNIGGLDTMEFGYTVGDIDIKSGYQRHFTDGVNRFAGTANPILSLASNAISFDTKYNYGSWSFGARGFSGAITDESLLENDPTISSQYMPAKLGLISGGESNVTFGTGRFALTAGIGMTNESDTVLGAQTGGLLGLGAADTTYIDTVARYSPTDDVTLSLRSTFARTTTNPNGEFIMGVSNIESNAFSAGIDIGNFNFAAALPLAATSGRMQYAHADYDVVENANGKFDIAVTDTHIANLDLTPEHREVRFSGAYRQKLGPVTDGAIGFIYRVNPNHTTEFGDESIFMLKISHRMGI